MSSTSPKSGKSTAIPAGTDVLPGKITKSPDGPHIRRRRAKLRGWRRRLYDYVVVPAEVPTKYNQSLAELIEEISTEDPVTAAAILSEAEATFDEASETIESAERRATTLLGTVAIAASLVVAGAGLLLDPAKVGDLHWRLVLSVFLAGFLIFLVGCGWRALAATGRIFEFEQPGPDRIQMRASRKGTDAQAFRAAELLRASGVAEEIGAVKVGLLRAATWWMRMALLWLVILVAALVMYVATAGNGDDGSPQSAPSPRPEFVG